jgi:hypothetical protein
MPDKLHIFISYKMPRSDDGAERIDIAREFARVLSDSSAGRIEAHYAGNFEDGMDWRSEIISTIKMCDMFLLLYTGAEEHWEFCLLEAGLFQATHPDRPLIVLHPPNVKRPTALAQLNAVTATVEDVKGFLNPIFYKPLCISEGLTDKGLTHIASELVRIFISDTSTPTNVEVVPSFILEMTSSEEMMDELRGGRIPKTTTIKGSHDWQKLFDKGIAIQSLKWKDLEKWSVRDFYDFKFSRMILAALDSNTPGGCFIRPSIEGQGGTLFRVALRRYELYANNTGRRFFFTAAPIDIPIFGIGDNTDSAETRNYHLLNVCWYTRRRLILQLQHRAEVLANSATPEPNEINELVDAIKDEIVSINIQTFIRKIDHPKTVEGIFPLEEIRDDQKKWIGNTSTIIDYKEDSKEDFRAVVEALQSMRAMNERYYIASAVGLAAAVEMNLGLRPKAPTVQERKPRKRSSKKA